MPGKDDNIVKNSPKEVLEDELAPLETMMAKFEKRGRESKEEEKAEPAQDNQPKRELSSMEKLFGPNRPGPVPMPKKTPMSPADKARANLKTPPAPPPQARQMDFTVVRSGNMIELNFTMPISKVAFTGNQAIDLGKKLVEFGKKANRTQEAILSVKPVGQ